MDASRDRARVRTAPAVLARIDNDTFDRLVDDAHGVTPIGPRLNALDREWDLDRAIEAEAALTGLAGLGLGLLVDRRWLALPAFVGAMLVTYATTGRYPLLPWLRRLGVRSASEIQRERHAVKALHGHFDAIERMPAGAATHAARTGAAS